MYINNKLKINEKKYTAIIGETPSKGARSPKLWNRAYNKFNIKCKMYPFDVYENNLKKLIVYLKKDKKFVGGSVTAPYKEKIIKYLDNISYESKIIGSINTIIKKDDKIIGENTDYHGVINTLKKIINKKKILILGCGGAGKAVILATIKNFNKSKIFIYNRNQSRILKFINNLEISKNIKVLNNLKQTKKLKNLDLIINTTSVGFDSWIKKNKKFENSKFFSPISNLNNIVNSNKKNEIEFLKNNLMLIMKNQKETYKFLYQNKKALVFDIIYNPVQTQLLYQAKMCNMKNINGMEMNLDQAIRAFMIVNNIKNEKKVRNAMIENG